jgi:hypothetical protein
VLALEDISECGRTRLARRNEKNAGLLLELRLVGWVCAAEGFEKTMLQKEREASKKKTREPFYSLQLAKESGVPVY